VAGMASLAFDLGSRHGYVCKGATLLRSLGLLVANITTRARVPLS
jgi:hypothetical protein